MIVMGLVLGITTSWALAQESDRAPRRLASPRDTMENQDREVRNDEQRPRANKEMRREAKRQQKRQGRADLAPLPPGRGIGGPGFRGGQDFQAPGRGQGRGQAYNRPWNAPRAGMRQQAEICPECKRPLGPFAGRGPGMSLGPQGQRFGGPALGANRPFGRGMGPYALNNQRPFGPRAGMGPMNRPPLNNDGQFRGRRQLDQQDGAPALRDQDAPRRPNANREFRDQEPPRRRPNADRNLRDQESPRSNRDNPDRPRPDDREE
jgi:hypothetical protein